jgi:hypothetical protein
LSTLDEPRPARPVIDGSRHVKVDVTCFRQLQFNGTTPAVEHRTDETHSRPRSIDSLLTIAKRGADWKGRLTVPSARALPQTRVRTTDAADPANDCAGNSAKAVGLLPSEHATKHQVSPGSKSALWSPRKTPCFRRPLQMAYSAQWEGSTAPPDFPASAAAGVLAVRQPVAVHCRIVSHRLRFGTQRAQQGPRQLQLPS